MLGSHIALCCAVDFVCCLCTAAAACAFDSRMSVLPVCISVVIWMLPKPHSVLYGPAMADVFASAYGCAAVFVCCAAGAYEGGFLRYGLASGMRGCASAVRFFALLLHTLLFFRSFPHFLLSFIPTSYFSVVALCARLCANLAFSLFALLIPLSSFHRIPFRPLIPLSLRAFPGGRLSSVDLLISGGIYYII